MSTPGSWSSPLTAADVARAATTYGQVALDAGRVLWTESRPSQGGRTVVLSQDGELTPFDARTRLHEYGGACWTTTPRGLVTSRGEDQRLWLVPPGGEPVALTADSGGTVRWACPVPLGDDHVLAVREVLPGGGALVAVPLSGGDPVVLWEGSRFLDWPRVSPDGRSLAFVTWEHPHMPWDATALRVGRLSGLSLQDVRVVLGGDGTSVLQPEWEADGQLRALTDASGWWNLVRGLETFTPVWSVDQECGGPAWQAGARWHATLADGAVAVLHGAAAKSLSVVAPDGAVRTLDLPFTAWHASLVADGTTVVGVAASPRLPWSVVAVSTVDGAWRTVASGPAPDPDWVPAAEAVTVASDGGREVHAVVWPPRHPERTAAAAPYVLNVHGGPTAQTPMAYDPTRTYFTSRGIGVVDVQYGGSTGYGRAYRELLHGQWGVVDVQDCEAVARWLLAGGQASSVLIRGGSAGGWTVLAALSRGGSVFTGGASYFGVVDLLPFAETTHDFESRYLDALIGPLPEARDLYVSRSPLSHVATLDRPLLVLQGSIDKVVPVQQAELLVQALRDNGVPHAYLLFDDEGHGFRRQDSQLRALESELAFYGAVLGFVPPGVAPLPLSSR